MNKFAKSINFKKEIYVGISYLDVQFLLIFPKLPRVQRADLMMAGKNLNWHLELTVV